jgi:AbrB family looped-hinge helix DNA binding protein
MHTRLSTKGRVIIPKVIRERHGWNAGTKLEIEDAVDGIVLRVATYVIGPTKLEDVLGCLRYCGKPKSIGEMNGGRLLSRP